MRLSTRFCLLEDALGRYEESRAAILPVPFERTTSWGKGTAGGPDAIIRASHYLEVYDQELECEPCRRGIATLSPFLPESFDLPAALRELEAEARGHMEAGKFLVTLGGEHSITAPLVRAAAGVWGEVGVVQFDAHADLRDTYEGTAESHACVMRRIVEAGLPTLAVGIRSLSAPEAAVIRDRSLPVIWGRELERSRDRFAKLLARLPERVYLTFDVDYFDPSLVPATGTPEPGGGTWYPTLALLRHLFRSRTVVAMDVVELAPRDSHPASDFLAAKLVYKCLGYLDEAETAAAGS